MSISVSSIFTKRESERVMFTASDEGFISALQSAAAAEKTETEQGSSVSGDMYVRSTAHKYTVFSWDEEYIWGDDYSWDKDPKKLDVNKDLNEEHSKYLATRRFDHLYVGNGQMEGILEKIEEGSRTGVPLEDILKEQRYREHGPFADSSVIHMNEHDDFFTVDLDTGDVISFGTRSRPLNRTEHDIDKAVGLALSDDLATFLRYTYFKRDDDDPEAVADILNEIKNTVGQYNNDRFLYVRDDSELAAEALSKYYEENADKIEEEERHAFNELMELIDRHFCIVNEGLDKWLERREEDTIDETSDEASGNYGGVLPFLRIYNAKDELELTNA